MVGYISWTVCRCRMRDDLKGESREGNGNHWRPHCLKNSVNRLFLPTFTLYSLSLFFFFVFSLYKYRGWMGNLWFSWCHTKWQGLLQNTTLLRNWSFSHRLLAFSEPSSLLIISGLPLPLPIYQSHPTGLSPNLALSSYQRISTKSSSRFFTMLLVFIFFWVFFSSPFTGKSGENWRFCVSFGFLVDLDWFKEPIWIMWRGFCFFSHQQWWMLWIHFFFHLFPHFLVHCLIFFTWDVGICYFFFLEWSWKLMIIALYAEGRC